MSLGTHSANFSAETETILSQVDCLRQAVQEFSTRSAQVEEQLRSERGRQSSITKDHQTRFRALQIRTENAERRGSDFEIESETRAHEILQLKAELERVVGEMTRIREVLRQAANQERETQRSREQLIQEVERRTYQANQQRQIDLDGIRDRDRVIAERDQIIAKLRLEVDRQRSKGDSITQ